MNQLGIENLIRITICFVILISTIFEFFKKKEKIYLLFGLMLTLFFGISTFFILKNDKILGKTLMRYSSTSITLYGGLKYRKEKKFENLLFLISGLISMFLKI